MKEIVFDTETTGLHAAGDDRIVEFGAIELNNHFPTGRTLHFYFNPERDMPESAFKVHGLSREFLSDKPLFAEKAAEIVAFIEDAKLVAHNAGFDMGFLNAELARANHGTVSPERVVDSLALARNRFPGASNTLDALCKRYGIDNTRRTKHGALLDAELLVEVYLELIGANQSVLSLDKSEEDEGQNATLTLKKTSLPVRKKPLKRRLSEVEQKAHQDFIAELGDVAIWKKYQTGT